jgi:hypothetical protein
VGRVRPRQPVAAVLRRRLRPAAHHLGRRREPDPGAVPVDPRASVQTPLSDPKAWAAQLPADTDTLATLVTLPEGGPTVVHPLGALEARQHVAPLETDIDHVGANPVDVPRVNLGQPMLHGERSATAQAISHATDLFSPGNFLNLTEDQKLSRPAFEPFPSGIVIAAATADVRDASSTNYQWFTFYPTSRHQPGTSTTTSRSRRSTTTCWRLAQPGSRTSTRAIHTRSLPEAMHRARRRNRDGALDLRPRPGGRREYRTNDDDGRGAHRVRPAISPTRRSRSIRVTGSLGDLQNFVLDAYRLPPSTSVQARGHRHRLIHLPALGTRRRGRGRPQRQQCTARERSTSASRCSRRTLS